MVQPAEGLPSGLGWQITETTIWCPLAELRATLIVKGDWTSYCIRYEESKKKGSSRLLGKCKGYPCACIDEYKDKLVTEERERARIVKTGNGQ